jgi:hypothetical protein
MSSATVAASWESIYAMNSLSEYFGSANEKIKTMNKRTIKTMNRRTYGSMKCVMTFPSSVSSMVPESEGTTSWSLEQISRQRQTKI